MKISHQWLQKRLPIQDISPKTIAEQLSMAGLEVDQFMPVAPEFHGVVVARVISAEKHPNADRLRLCQVDIGQAEPLQIVCGGHNVRADLKIALATCGAVLPGGFAIKASKIRGSESFGMICSAKELGLSEESDGSIMELPEDAPVGTDFRDYWQLNDVIYEIDLTPNRGDCLSVEGIARELAAINQLPLAPLAIEPVPAELPDMLSLELKAPNACAHYLGRIIKNINPDVITPLWMSFALERAGIRLIHPVVDITNYVMLELGQPMHAFDLNKLQAPIQIRYAETGESLTLLNQQTVALNSDTLVIADTSHSLAMAGIMGGEASSVSENTRDIFLESAWFVPEAIAGRARHYGLSTDSAYRFERGVDPALARTAIERASQLIQSICGGQVGPVSEVLSKPHLPAQTKIELALEKVNRYLGLSLEAAIITALLERLGFRVISQSSGHFEIEIPSYRLDIRLDVDVIEEIARLHGYQNLATCLPNLTYRQQRHRSENHISLYSIKNHLCSRGFQEVITYSFVDPEFQRYFADSSAEPARLLNPIAPELSEMRVSLWPGLLQVLMQNQRRQLTRLRMFELARVFLSSSADPKVQPLKLAGLICGRAEPEQWSQSDRKADFYDLKGEVEELVSLTRGQSFLSFRPAEHPALHPGQSAEIFYQNQAIGWIGALHPTLIKKFDLPQPIFLFEISANILQNKGLPRYRAYSRFQSSRRDLAFLIDKNVLAGEVIDFIHNNVSDTVIDSFIFDIYEGEQLSQDKKSIAIALILQDMERTLTDNDIQSEVDRLVEKLKQQFKAELRV